MEKLKQINFRKNPYRGILKEVAIEEQVSQQSIWNAIKIHQNIRIITIVTQKMNNRKQLFNDAIKNFNNEVLV